MSGSTICCGRHSLRASHPHPAARLLMAGICSERATKTWQYDLLRPKQLRKSDQDPAVRFVTVDICAERATKTRQYFLLRPTLAQNEPPRSGRATCYGGHLLRQNHQCPAVRFVTADSLQSGIFEAFPNALWSLLGGRERCAFEVFPNTFCSWEGVQVAKILPCILQPFPLPCVQLQRCGLWGVVWGCCVHTQCTACTAVWLKPALPPPLPSPPFRVGCNVWGWFRFRACRV